MTTLATLRARKQKLLERLLGLPHAVDYAVADVSPKGAQITSSARDGCARRLVCAGASLLAFQISIP
jgi:hypothetical protein